MKLNQTGFTLIEILLVVAIAALITGLGVVYFDKNNDRIDIRNQTELVVTKLKEAQNLVLTGAVIDGQVVEKIRVYQETCAIGDDCVMEFYLNNNSLPYETLEYGDDFAVEIKHNGSHLIPGDSLDIEYSAPNADMKLIAKNGALETEYTDRAAYIFIHYKTNLKRIFIHPLSGRIYID